MTSDPEQPEPSEPTSLESDISVEQMIERWIRRFNRSLAFYAERFEEEQFHDLVSALVTSAFIERALLFGIQLAGFEVNPHKAVAFTLERLVKIAAQQGWLSRELRRMLYRFADIRNSIAHDIDYHLTPEAVASLRAPLPAASEAELQRALANVIEPSTSLIATLVYEQMAVLVFKASQVAGGSELPT